MTRSVMLLVAFIVARIVELAISGCRTIATAKYANVSADRSGLSLRLSTEAKLATLSQGSFLMHLLGPHRRVHEYDAAHQAWRAGRGPRPKPPSRGDRFAVAAFRLGAAFGLAIAIVCGTGVPAAYAPPPEPTAIVEVAQPAKADAILDMSAVSPAYRQFAKAADAAEGVPDAIAGMEERKRSSREAFVQTSDILEQTSVAPRFPHHSSQDERPVDQVASAPSAGSST